MAKKKEAKQAKKQGSIKKTEKSKTKRADTKKYPSLRLKSKRDIAMDFAQKVYKNFDKMVKSVILFGSAAKHKEVLGSDIDIIIVIDDASVKFDDKLVVWYREELGRLIRENPYKRDLHINTIKLTTWWQDLSRGDPTIVNVLRYGEPLIDFGGFFNPLKLLLQDGKIKPTAEAIYTALNRIPMHILRSKQSEISAIEGCYWAMVDTAQSMLMAIKVLPPSPEHIPGLLNEHLVSKRLLKPIYVHRFQELYNLHKDVMHGEITNIKGEIIDGWQDASEEFFKVAMKLIKEII